VIDGDAALRIDGDTREIEAELPDRRRATGRDQHAYRERR